MKRLTKIIQFLYLLLLFATPLIFTFFNSELFELPKMYFVYLVTVLIVALHLINWIKKELPLFKKTFLDIPIILFLISQTISTIVSIDIHTSFFGYYSRLNGGLLSLISFSLLYWVLAVYIDKKFKEKIIFTVISSGLLLSIFGITQHFGSDKSLWVQDVQSRVFSTLGQPNWLAAFLVMIIPFSIQRFLKSTNLKTQIYYLITSVSFYTCLLFTKSKSGIIAAVISLLLFFSFKFISSKSKTKQLKKLLLIASIIVLSSLFIKNPIQDKLLTLNSKIQPKQTTINEEDTQQLNITPSEDIRKIVWKGAIDLWKQYPLFGTGTETFAYSYYWTRPVAHNLTSEWNFLYNKAHNEYLNFLATTGIVGLTTYLFLISTILFKAFKKNKTLFTSILALLITNIAGFSVVATSLLLFLLPTLLLKETNSKVKIKNTNKNYLLPLIILLSLFSIQKTINFYTADVIFAKSKKFDDIQEYKTSFDLLEKTLTLRPNQPNYLAKHAIIASKLALTTKDQSYVDIAINSGNKAIEKSPANINIWKEKAQSLYYLSAIDTKYFQEAINSLLQVQKLSPTDAKNLYTIGQFLESVQLNNQAIPYYQEAIKLKGNYDYAYFSLANIYLDQKEYQLAKENLENTLKYAPNSQDAKNLLKNIININ